MHSLALHVTHYDVRTCVRACVCVDVCCVCSISILYLSLACLPCTLPVVYLLFFVDYFCVLHTF